MPGAQERATQGKPPRLTKQLIEDVVASLRMGTPINWATEFVWVSRDRHYEWIKRSKVAQATPAHNRSQLDRLCIEYEARTRQAVADWTTRSVIGIGQAGGLTRERPKRRRTTQRIVSRDETPIVVDADGQVHGGIVVEVQVTEEEIAADWKALDRVLARRHHEEWTGNQGLGEGEGEAAPEVSDAQMMSALSRAAKAAGIDPAAIEARSWPTPADGPPELAAAATDEEKG